MVGRVNMYTPGVALYMCLITEIIDSTSVKIKVMKGLHIVWDVYLGVLTIAPDMRTGGEPGGVFSCTSPGY